jgi:tetratricopeptide (TPR) repeat protein
MRRLIVLMTILILAAALPAGLCGAAPNTERDALMKKGVELHDAGSYKAAIETYQQILEKNPRDANALYEISNSYLALGDFKNCLDFAQRSLAIQTSAYTFSMVASCQDELNDVDGALATFARAMQSYPGDVMLNFNYAVTLTRQNRSAEAKQHLQTAIKADPRYPSPVYVYANMLDAEQNPVGAFYLWLRFLTLEPASQRSHEVAQKLYALVSPTKDGEGSKDTTVTLKAGSSKHDGFPADLATMQMFFHVTVKTGSGDKSVTATPAATFVSTAKVLLGLFRKNIEDNASDLRSFEWQTAGVPLMVLEKKKLTEAFLYYIAALANVEGGREWLKDHTTEFDGLKQYLTKRD